MITKERKQQIREFVIDNHEKMSGVQMAMRLNCDASTINAAKRSLGIRRTIYNRKAVVKNGNSEFFQFSNEYELFIG